MTSKIQDTFELRLPSIHLRIPSDLKICDIISRKQYVHCKNVLHTNKYNYIF